MEIFQLLSDVGPLRAAANSAASAPREGHEIARLGFTIWASRINYIILGVPCYYYFCIMDPQAILIIKAPILGFSVQIIQMSGCHRGRL